MANSGVALSGTVAGRRVRIMDRARILEDWIEAAMSGGDCACAPDGGNVCIVLLTGCASLIGRTIVALFFGETTQLQILRLARSHFYPASSVFCWRFFAF